MSEPKIEVDYNSFWQGYQMQYQDIEAARTRELATSRMRMSMAGMTPDSDNWSKALTDINAKYDTELETLRGGEEYDQLKEGFLGMLAATDPGPNPAITPMLSDNDAGTYAENRQKEYDEKVVRQQEILAGFGLTPEQATRMQYAGSGMEEIYSQDPQGNLIRTKVTDEDRKNFDTALSNYYSTVFETEDYTAKSPGQQALDTAKQAAAGGMGGRRVGSGGAGGGSESPNAGKSGLMNPLGMADDEEEANPWI